MPAGRFLTGAIHLKSNVELHVAEGATLLFDTNPASYPLVFTRWEGMELMNYSPLIYARREEHRDHRQGHARRPGQREELVGLEGAVGGHDGVRLEGRHAGPAPGARKKLFEMAEDGVPVKERVFGDGCDAAPAVHPAL